MVGRSPRAAVARPRYRLRAAVDPLQQRVVCADPAVLGRPHLLQWATPARALRALAGAGRLRGDWRRLSARERHELDPAAPLQLGVRKGVHRDWRRLRATDAEAAVAGRLPVEGYSIALDSAHAIGWACSQALEGGFAFARKFVGMRAKAIDGLQRCQRMSHKQMAGVATLGGRYKVPKLRSAPKWRDEAFLGGRGGAEARADQWSSTAPRRRWERVRREQRRRLPRRVLGYTRRRRRHRVLRVLGYTPSLQGCVESPRLSSSLLGVELHGASGALVRGIAPRCTSPDSRRTGEGACFAVVDGSWWPVLTSRAATRSPTRPSCVNTRSARQAVAARRGQLRKGGQCRRGREIQGGGPVGIGLDNSTY